MTTKNDRPLLGDLVQNPNTAVEYDREFDSLTLNRFLESLRDDFTESSSYACYILGMGSQPSSMYKQLRRETGIRVIWSKSVLPGIFKLFSPIVASYAGLISIDNFRKLPLIFDKLSNHSMVGIYIFDRVFENAFVKATKRYPKENDFTFGIKSDPSYYIHLIDMDNFESRTGAVEVVSYGIECRIKDKLSNN